jgi:hypothetical protein
MSKPILTQERLKDVLNYDPETGVFVWIKQASSNALIGSVAGTPHSEGYCHIQIDGAKILAHRLAWLYMTGAFPPNDIDHIDRNPANNRFANLRAVTKSENQHNRKKNRTNTSGFKGVYYQKSRGKWKANIGLNGVIKHLGTFFTPEEASAAYLAAQRIYHPTCPTI